MKNLKFVLTLYGMAFGLFLQSCHNKNSKENDILNATLNNMIMYNNEVYNRIYGNYVCFGNAVLYGSLMEDVTIYYQKRNSIIKNGKEPILSKEKALTLHQEMLRLSAKNNFNIPPFKYNQNSNDDYLQSFEVLNIEHLFLEKFQSKFQACEHPFP